MFLAFGLLDIIKVPFGYLLELLYRWTSNYGVALILFSLIVKLLLLYPTAKGKKGMMKTTRLAPKLKELEKKYGDDKEAYANATRALYKAEGASPTSGCLWSFLPLFILILLYSIIRFPMQYMLHMTSEQAAAVVKIIQDGGIELGKNTAYHQMIATNYIPQFADAIRAAMPEISETALKGMDFGFLGLNLSAIPSFKIWAYEVYDWANIGLFVLPFVSAVSQLLVSLITQKLNNSIITNEKGERDKEAADSAANQTTKTMIYMMPLMSLWIGFAMPAALSVYWIAQAVFSGLQEYVLTAIFRKDYDEEDARRQEIALQKAIEEAEKERIRAQRRAENPDGITENTSKKKQQIKQREEAAAAAREYAAKQRTAQGLPPEDLPLSGIAERPYCKGRAYQPDRYGRNTYDAADE